MTSLKFVRRRIEASDITSFIFEPDQPLDWQAGQSLKLEVPTVYGPSEHRFSIASAPCEGHVMVTTRLSGSIYKNGLDSLRPGDKVQGGGVEGDFIWTTKTPVILVATGIGVTPFRSILFQRQNDQLPLNATLIIGARGHEVIYRDEFDKLQVTHPELKIVYCLDQRLNAAFISQHAPELTVQTIYVSGPSAMVDELGEQLTGHGVVDNIKKDWFTGKVDY